MVLDTGRTLTESKRIESEKYCYEESPFSADFMVY
jgi:hypothetical protein